MGFVLHACLLYIWSLEMVVDISASFFTWTQLAGDRRQPSVLPHIGPCRSATRYGPFAAQHSVFKSALATATTPFAAPHSAFILETDTSLSPHPTQTIHTTLILTNSRRYGNLTSQRKPHRLGSQHKGNFPKRGVTDGSLLSFDLRFFLLRSHSTSDT